MANDVIIIGAGHNGLVAANYLARAGLTVTVLERRSVVGGACVTEELIPGFKCSSCAYVAGLMRPQIIRDLELPRFGLELYQTDVLNCSVLPDGRHFFLWPQLDRTLRELDRLAAGESERFVEFGGRMRRFASIVEPWLLRSPPSLSEVLATFEEKGELELFEDFTMLSVKDLLDRYLTSEELKGLLTFFAVVSVFGGPRTPGTAYVYGHHSSGEFKGNFGQYGFARGGMGSISHSLAASARARGVTIRTEAAVQRVSVEHGQATGVVLEDGEEIGADAVMANSDPVRTFLQLVDASDLPGDFLQQVKQIDVRGSMARVHLALEDLPEFKDLPRGEGPQHRGLTLLGAEVGRFERAWEAQKYGRVPDELAIELIVPSTHDPTVAPKGNHLLITGVQQLPLKLESGTWDDVKDQFTNKVIETLCSYAPGLDELIIDTATITPLDLEREYCLSGGNIFQGAMTLGQLFASRPRPKCGDYTTPIGSLYLCGAGTHPGGGVIGANGHNAAQRLLVDRFGGKDGRQTTAAARAGGGSLLDRALGRPKARRAMVKLARQRWMRPVVRAATRKRSWQ